MADRAGDNPRRTAADKERSRQLSRPVSGKEAARQVGRSTRPAQGRPQNGRRAAGDRRGQQQTTGRGRQPQGRPAGQRNQGRRPSQRPRRPAARPGRSRTALFTWGAVAIVLVVVIVVVLISQSGTTKNGLIYTPKPVSASIVHEVTHVPASVYNTVGTGVAGSIHTPAVVSGQPPLTYHGKPGAFALLGEFCPYCAAERWSIITALSRFGTFSGLRTMQSAPKDVYGKTQTFEFKTATYSSKYLGANLLEFYGQEKATGKRPVISKITKSELALISKYDKSTSTSSGGTIPFMDFGNKVFFAGASFSPTPLQGLSRATIAASLRNPHNGVTQLIIGTANYMSAAICAIDGGKPGAVCHSAGVQAAAKALKLSI